MAIREGVPQAAKPMRKRLQEESTQVPPSPSQTAELRVVTRSRRCTYARRLTRGSFELVTEWSSFSRFRTLTISMFGRSLDPLCSSALVAAATLRFAIESALAPDSALRGTPPCRASSDRALTLTNIGSSPIPRSDSSGELFAISPFLGAPERGKR